MRFMTLLETAYPWFLSEVVEDLGSKGIGTYDGISVIGFDIEDVGDSHQFDRKG